MNSDEHGPGPIELKGVPGSPYTRKMVALLRYRHIPYRWHIGNQLTVDELPQPKVNLLPTFYLPDAAGKLEAVVDSTPIIRRLEAMFPQRSVLAPDPALDFVNFLLEDFADEWLSKAMFHYRWSYQADIDRAAAILPLSIRLDLSPADHAEAARMFSRRQIDRLYVVGSNDITAPVIEDSYRRLLALLDGLLTRQPFLMGNRPGACDFAVYGQLTQLARFDPTPEAICLQQAPRVFAWTEVVDDLSGLPAAAGDWLAFDIARERLGGMLAEMGRVYVPLLLANAEALAAGREQLETIVDGRRWVQSAFPYQSKCLHWIRQAFVALTPGDRQRVLGLLRGTGCEALLE